MEKDYRLTIFNSDGEPEEIPVPEKYLYLGEVEDMNAAILDSAPCFLSLDETRNHVKTVLALYKSAETVSLVYMNNFRS